MRVKLNGNDFYEVSTQFGVTDFIHKTPHTGVDLVMESGTNLFSPVDGVVSKIMDYGTENIGKGISIKTGDGENVIMGHLSDIKVNVGDTIHEGDLVALSGNTGHSTGAHLHLGLKDSHGAFTNPDSLLGSDSITHGVSRAGVHVTEGSKGMIGQFKDMMDFINQVKEHGFFHAIYGKSFFEVLIDFFKELGHDVGLYLLSNGDLFFLLPAIGFMFFTFFIGKNKYTKWIIPLWFAYFVTRVLRAVII